MRDSSPGLRKRSIRATRLADLALRKDDRAWVSNGDRPRLGERMRADLTQRRPRLGNQQIDHMLRPGRPERAQAPEKSLAGEACLGAERDRADHVGAAADAAVH